MIEQITQIPFKFFGFIFAHIINSVPKAMNLLRRPKLSVSMKLGSITFSSIDNKEHKFTYFTLTIKNMCSKSYKLNLGGGLVNKESYQSIVSSDINFSKFSNESKEPWVKCDDDVYNFIKENKQKIQKNTCIYEVEPHQAIDLPMNLLGTRAKYIIDKKNKTNLFCQNSKICISLEINNKIYDYGVDRKNAYEKLICYLFEHTNEGS